MQSTHYVLVLILLYTRGGGGGGEESAKFFPSQRHEIFILQCVRVSEAYPTISEDFSKLSRMFQKMLKF